MNSQNRTSGRAKEGAILQSFVEEKVLEGFDRGKGRHQVEMVRPLQGEGTA